MKKVLGFIAILLVLCAGMASADLTNWTFGILGTGTNGTNTFIGDRWNVIGAWSTYTDGLNSSLGYYALPPFGEGSTPPMAAGDWVAVRQGTSPAGCTDVRAKYAASPAGTSKTWTMSIYWYQVNTTTPAPTSVTLQITPGVDKIGASIPGTSGDLPDTDGVLTYLYDFSLNGGPVTTYRASQLANGLTYQFAAHDQAHADTLTVTVRTVPEPGSLLALLGSLAGVAAARRFRKR